jgi:hypothetical protein
VSGNGLVRGKGLQDAGRQWGINLFKAPSDAFDDTDYLYPVMAEKTMAKG